MTSQRSIKLLITSFVIATLILLSIFFVMLSSGILSKRTAGIALPAEGGYVEAWTQHLPQISRAVGIPEVTIYTYDSIEKLENFFLQPEKYNLLWAEVPVSGKYNLKLLADKVQLESIDNKLFELYPPCLVRSVNQISPKLANKFYVLSYNPWLMIKNTKSNKKTEFVYSIGASTEAGMLATLCLTKKLFSNNQYFISNENALMALKEMSNNNTLIRNAHSYTEKDSLNNIENSIADKDFMSTSYFNTLSVSERMQLTILPFSPIMTTEITIALFPIRKSEESKAAIQNIKELLVSPELIYAAANSRNWLPGQINTVSRSVYTDYIRKQARTSNSCLIPSMQFSSEEEEQVLLSQIKLSLSSDYVY